MKTRFVVTLMIGLFLSQEAFTSAVLNNTVTLPDLVERSEAILVVEPIARDDTHFHILEILKKTNLKLKVDAKIEVLGANYDLFQQIRQASLENRPVPIPILDAYPSTLQTDQLHAQKSFIIFVKSRTDSRFEYTVENAFESASKIKTVVKLISK